MSAKQLEKIAGFKLPGSFVNILEGFTTKYGALDEAISHFTDCINCVRFVTVSDARKYENTPLEIWPFIGSGSDGEHYGYLNLAPELAQDDLPLVCYSPMGGYVDFWGNSTKEGLENLISYIHAKEDFDNVDLPFLKSLGIYPDESKSGSDFMTLNYEVSDLKTPPILKPEGYTFVMTEDGVGVLAQTNMFNPVEDLNALRDIPIDDFIRLAQENMDAGFWGNALFYLKECWHRGLLQ